MLGPEPTVLSMLRIKGNSFAFLAPKEYMKDFFRKTLETVGERINSPMLSSTAVAWAAINYKFLIVVISNEDFRKKFEYIENTLYPNMESGLKLGVEYPILFGLFYTLIYPLIDIVLAAAYEWINNLKERAIISVRRKKPIDRDLTNDYFSNFDSQLETKQKSLESILEAQNSERKSSSARIADLKQRLKRQARLALCGSSYLTPEIIDSALIHDQGSLSELGDPEKIVAGFKEIRLRNELLIALQIIDETPRDKYGRRIIHRGDFQNPTLNPGFQIPDDVIEILLALDLLEEVDDSTGRFKATSIDERIMRLRALLAEP